MWLLGNKPGFSGREAVLLASDLDQQVVHKYRVVRGRIMEEKIKKIGKLGPGGHS